MPDIAFYDIPMIRYECITKDGPSKSYTDLGKETKSSICAIYTFIHSSIASCIWVCIYACVYRFMFLFSSSNHTSSIVYEILHNQMALVDHEQIKDIKEII